MSDLLMFRTKYGFLFSSLKLLVVAVYYLSCQILGKT